MICPPAKGNLVAIELVTVVEKFASSPSAAANSLSVFNALGLLSIRFVTACPTNAVVATFVVASLAACVVAVVPLAKVLPDKLRLLTVVLRAAISTPSTVPVTVMFPVTSIPGPTSRLFAIVACPLLFIDHKTV